MDFNSFQKLFGALAFSCMVLAQPFNTKPTKALAIKDLSPKTAILRETAQNTLTIQINN